MMLFSETETAKQNQKFPFHFFFRFAVEGWGEETREKCKEIFWFLHTRVRERVRGAHHWSFRSKKVRAKATISPPMIYCHSAVQKNGGYPQIILHSFLLLSTSLML
jgi:hypothetical protein